MCKTTAGNSCDVVTITEPDGDRSRRLGIVLRLFVFVHNLCMHLHAACSARQRLLRMLTPLAQRARPSGRKQRVVDDARDSRFSDQ